MNEVGAYGRPKLQGVADSPKEAATNLIKKITIMETLANINGNMNIKLNKIVIDEEVAPIVRRDCKNQWQCKLKF